MPSILHVPVLLPESFVYTSPGLLYGTEIRTHESSLGEYSSVPIHHTHTSGAGLLVCPFGPLALALKWGVEFLHPGFYR